jgi:hypothetical protein
MNLGKYEVIMRLATHAGMSSPVTGITLPPVEPTGFADEVRRLSRQTYARPVTEVETEISRRRGGTQQSSTQNTNQTNRPRFGGPRTGA